MTPRPGVRWPASTAVIAHDAQIVSAGITTVFDALSIGDINPKGERIAMLPLMVQAIDYAQQCGHLRAEHHLHMRCEISQGQTLEVLQQILDGYPVSLASLMDHTPGQRQFVLMEKYREYYQGKYQLSDQQMEDFIVLQLENFEKYSVTQRKAVADLCRERGIVLATHDDATEEHIHEALKYEVSISEFPTTHLAAGLSHCKGLKVLMGAPNIVRGGSHSGNISAADLLKKGFLDILSSDYYPLSLLSAVERLQREELCSLPQAVALVTSCPAEALNLIDRGSIKPGLRADIIRIRSSEGQLIVSEVLRAGQRVF